jgi:hypothetical protein
MKGLSRFQQFGLLCLGLAFCVFVAGCGGGNVTKANYDKIKTDDKLEDVEKVMGGKGTELTEEQLKKMSLPAAPAGVKIYRWGDDNKYILVTVADNKVKTKTEKGL